MTFTTPTKRLSWSELSLEYKLFFGFHICNMVMFMLGGLLSIPVELGVVAIYAAVFVVLSLRHRSIAGWRWPGVRPLNVLMALGAIAGAGVFLFSATSLFPPADPRTLPWYIAGVGIGLFWVLTALRVVEPSEATFIQQRGLPALSLAETATAGEAVWKLVMRVVWWVMWIGAWLAGVASQYYFGLALQHGAAAPTATQTEAIRNHGQVVYIALQEKAWLDLLGLVQCIGIPLAIALAIVVHFILGVKLLPNVPTLAELRAKRRGGGEGGDGR